MKINSYKGLIVWQKSMKLVKLIYSATSSFPKEEQYGLVNQIRRAAVSIPSNIAEGYGRKSQKEYLRFYSIAYGSALELETQIIIAKELNLINIINSKNIDFLLTEVIKMLYVLVYRHKERRALAAT